MNNAVNCEFINLYADDILLAVSGKSNDEFLAKMNIELVKLANYFQINKLKLNINNIKVIIIAKPNKINNLNLHNINSYLKNQKIEIVKNMKYLHVVAINENLNFKEHSLKNL